MVRDTPRGGGVGGSSTPLANCSLAEMLRIAAVKQSMFFAPRVIFNLIAAVEAA